MIMISIPRTSAIYMRARTTHTINKSHDTVSSDGEAYLLVVSYVGTLPLEHSDERSRNLDEPVVSPKHRKRRPFRIRQK